MAQYHAPLRPFIRRLRLESFVKSFFTALAAGVSAGLAAMLVMRIIGLRYNWLILLIAAASVAVIMLFVGYFWLFRFSEKELIRRIDRAGLHDCVSTMIEYWDDTSFIAKKQREDTIRRIKAAKTHAVSFQIPFVAAVVLLSVSLSTAVTALIPPHKTRVTPADSIVDTYAISSPALDSIKDLTIDSIKKEYPTLSDEIVDELQWILDEIEKLTGSRLDHITELEKLKHYLEELLKENAYGLLVSDYMKEYSSLRALANAISTYNKSGVHAALYAMCKTYPDLVLELATELKRMRVTTSVKNDLMTQLNVLNSSFGGNADTFDNQEYDVNDILQYNDQSKLSNFINQLTEEYPSKIMPEGSIELLLQNSADFGPLAEALINGTVEDMSAALYAIKDSCLKDGEVDMSRVNTLVSQLRSALDLTTDSEADNDSTYNAVNKLFQSLTQDTGTMVGVILTTDDLDDIFGNTETGKRGTAQSSFSRAYTDRYNDTKFFLAAIEGLTDIREGKAVARYLWNEQGECEWYASDDGMNGGVAYDLHDALANRAGLHESYKEAPLVNALYELRDVLKNAASKATRHSSNNYIKDLIGSPVPTATHQTHNTPEVLLSKICDDLLAALIPEEQMKDAIEDVKDQIQDAIDDLLGKDESEKDENKNNTGIDVKPPQTTPTDTPNFSTDGDEENSEDQESPSGGGGSYEGETDYSGLTFFDSTTGEQKTLDRQTLEEFKLKIDQAIAEGNYSAEEQTQMYNYYNYLLQKIDESED